MKRFLFPLAALAVAALSVTVDLSSPPADSTVCLRGGCRFDQILATGATSETVAALLNETPADPGIWCTYGEFFATHGDPDKAKAAFDRALSLGPGVSSVLMRVANFDFTHGHTREGLRLTQQILSQTDEFDGILFSYLGNSGEPVPRMLDTAIPNSPRAARSWLRFVGSRGSDRDLLDTWEWMRNHRLDDDKSASETASDLWQRKSYRGAQELWAARLGTARGDYLKPQLLANVRFQEAPSAVPFGWSLNARAGVEFIRGGGLEIHFLGQQNLNNTGLEQATAVEPGRYRFSAEVSGDNITTDEGPFFQITDPENGGRLNLETQPMLGNRSRAWISTDFTVPPGTHIVRIGLTRRPSLKFDNKIAGTLHIYQVSLVPASKT